MPWRVARLLSARYCATVAQERYAPATPFARILPRLRLYVDIMQRQMREGE